jgi:transcriptional regulator with XRE-family HTH domain
MPVDIHIRFGRAIRRVREEQRINQEEAAERCGLDRTYYSGIECGVRNVSLVNIEGISKGLRIPISQLSPDSSDRITYIQQPAGCSCSRFVDLIAIAS